MSGSRQKFGEALRPATASTVYGPVRSWRVGLSLGVDLLFVDSICSFRCTYCQLGKINVHTTERKVFVPTERVIRDLKHSAWAAADVITFSGSGEPTLAANLGEVIREIKGLTGKPVLVLTNATLLNQEAVRLELCEADSVFCKLDAADEAHFRLINRPVAGLTLKSVVEGIKKLRAEYRGRLGLQLMLMRLHQARVEELAALLKEIGPDEVQLSAPLRPIPHGWFLDARANYASAPYEAVYPKAIGPDAVKGVEAALRKLTALRVTSVYS
jgi:wyosine [tRNA(Phe)-imidazoG37] synthetase (radical SAM superfamily)